eukprot:TRINITY_DN4605_c0_g1_i1.p1 TRINITY_DN4605_c0_g1~~TRINITY_DN4605_c0_g1_i1.p1  ORF type:complete len:475 (-),score=105.12 TRINITY_DN4605_c0_g1_i1:73-1497(-)
MGKVRPPTVSSKVLLGCCVLILIYLCVIFRATPSTPNTALTDEIIVVPGHKLYPDGMPSRILKERVEEASTLYHSLTSKGHHPLIIMSGKGKSNKPDYTEAHEMRELAIGFKVPEADIILDPESTNTAENALFSSKIISERPNIHQAFVVTSDFHIPRVQYNFQTVVPSDVELEFVSVATNLADISQVERRERELLDSSMKDLIKLNLLSEDSSFGYHPLRNMPRWMMIERELKKDIHKLMKDGDSDGAQALRQGLGVTTVDYGSNYGFFSVQMAKFMPEGTVVSCEGEAYSEYKGANDFHTEKMKTEGLKNNYLCRTTLKPDFFTQLRKQGQIYTYQFCLSVFHWLNPMEDREQFEQTLSNMLLNARTTFLELPEAMEYKGSEGQHAWKKVNKWYAGRTELEILEDLAQKYNLKMTIKQLGVILHDNKTVRRMFRVTVTDASPEIDVDTVVSTYKCAAVVGGPEYDFNAKATN